MTRLKGALAAIAATLCACSSVNMFPPSKTGGGDDGHGGMGTEDGGVVDGGSGAGSRVTGRVCLVTDLRTPQTGCAGNDVDGLTVTLGTSATTTTATGGFALDLPVGTNLVWSVSGTTLNTHVPIETSLESFNTTSGVVIPAIAQTDYESQVDVSGADFDNATQGSVIVQVTEGGAALKSEVGLVSPSSVAILYDGGNSQDWGTDATSTHGVVWATGIPGGAATIEVLPASQAGSGFGSGSGSGDGEATGVTIENGAITFVQIDTL